MHHTSSKSLAATEAALQGGCFLRGDPVHILQRSFVV